MALTRVAQHGDHLGQYQWRYGPSLVSPAQQATAQDQLGLLKGPVGKCRVATLSVRQVEAGNLELTVSRAADVEFGTIDHQLLKPQTPQRTGR